MRFLAPLAVGALARFAAAASQGPLVPAVTIYDDPYYQGEKITFPPDGTCQSLGSDNDKCAGEGGAVIIFSIPQIAEGVTWSGIICGVLTT
ncbi:hypothetical protein BDW59DRAFT_161402 [Aspergillus cavernicola]|uniref:Uncharacterized protein n=1 Tax=Aspergillus cavernicola TaxID=176166 RepID=A0ABR4IDB3_9EURO